MNQISIDIDCTWYNTYRNSSVKWHVIYTISKRDLYDDYDENMSPEDIKQVK